MPWKLESRDGQVCVIKESDGSVAGCHSSRADAIKQQRALYANESRMASMYAELDAYGGVAVAPINIEPSNDPPVPGGPPPSTSPVMAEILALLARDQQEKSLVASVAEHQSLISQQFAEAQQERQALVAALGRMGSPTINLPAQAAPEVNVHVPPAEVNVASPEVNVHVPPAAVTVNSPPVGGPLRKGRRRRLEQIGAEEDWLAVVLSEV